MLKVILVDDEKIIREGIRKIILENCTDLYIAGEAANGKEALEISLKLVPDIAIIDIRMPVMDGLEYLRTVKEQLPRLKVVILSGYADFSYARESLNLGCSYYCLKPINHAELIGEINKLREEILLDQQKAERETMIEKEIKETSIQRRNLFLNRLIKNELPRSLNILDKLKSYNLGMLAECFYLAVIDIDDFYMKIKRVSYDMEGNRNYLLFPLVEKVQDMVNCSTAFNGAAFGSDYREMVIVLSNNRSTAKETTFAVQSLLSKIQRVLMEYHDVSVTIGYFGLCGNISLITNAYECAREAVQKRFKEGGGKIFHCSRIESDIITYPVKEESELMGSLENPDKSGIVIHLDNIIKYLSDRRIDRNMCNSMLCRLYMIVQQHLASMNAHELLQCIPSCSNFEKYLNEIDFFHNVRLYIYDIFDRIYEGIKASSNDPTRKIVRIARDYMEKNYNKDLSLYDVAQHVNMNPNYLSMLFKKEIGDTFTDYLIRLKIEKAKILLKESTYRAHEIAIKVGYNDPKHFSKIFKKVIGITPTEYRETCHI